MAGFLKKFTKKKKTQDLHPVKDRTSSSYPVKEVHHGFVDSVGGLNFPISPASKKPFHRTHSDPSEFTILWSRPSFERKGTKMNPVFVEEPADFYEDVYIPPDNAHDFSVLPRYRVNEAYGNEGKDSLFRSRSIGAIPSFVNENHGMKLSDVKKRRKNLASTSEGRLFGFFENNRQSPSFASPDNSRDSGVYQELDESMEETQVRKMVSSDSGTASAEDLVEQTFEDSNCMKSSSEHTETYDLSHSEGGLERRFSKLSLDKSFGGRVFYVSQTSFPSDPTAKVIIREDVAHRYARSQSNNASETRFHDGSLSRSMPHINTVGQRDGCSSDPDADLNSVEQRLNTVESRLDVFLKRNSQEETQLIESKQYSKNVLDSPDLAAMLKGRVLSVKRSLEEEQNKSKSMSNLTSTKDYEDSSDEEFFEEKRMTSAASFGHINVNSLSPLLNDRKFFSKMIVSKESRKNSNQQARKGSASGQRRKKANATSSEESEGSIERGNGPVEGQTSSLERPSNVLLEQQSSSLEQQSHKLEGQSNPPERHNRTLEGKSNATERQNSAFEQQNSSPERRNSSLERHRNTSEEQSSGLEQLGPPERRTKTDILSNSDGTFRTLRRSVGGDDDDEKANIVKARIGVVTVPKFTLSDLNIQQGKGTTSPGYLHSEGTFNTFTGAGVSILDTNYEIQDTHVIRKKPSVESFLRDMNRSELPHVVEDDDVSWKVSL